MSSGCDPSGEGGSRFLPLKAGGANKACYTNTRKAAVDWVPEKSRGRSDLLSHRLPLPGCRAAHWQVLADGRVPHRGPEVSLRLLISGRPGAHERLGTQAVRIHGRKKGYRGLAWLPLSQTAPSRRQRSATRMGGQTGGESDLTAI